MALERYLLRPSILLWVLSYAGILLIFGHDMVTLGSEVLFGTVLVFISAVSFAVYTLWSKPLIAKVGSLMFTCIAMISASVLILLHFSLTHSFNDLQVSNDALLICAAIALFATVIPSFLVAEARYNILTVIIFSYFLQ